MASKLTLKLKSETEALLAEIDDFLAEKKISESYFGKSAVGNSELVKRMRGGGRVWPETIERVRDFMKSNKGMRSRNVA